MNDKLANLSPDELRMKCSELSLMRISPDEIARRLDLPRAKIAEYVSMIRDEEVFKAERGLDSAHKEYIMRQVEASELREKMLWKTLPPDVLDEGVTPSPSIANTLSHIRDEVKFRDNMLQEFGYLPRQNMGMEIQHWETALLELTNSSQPEVSDANIERILAASSGETAMVYGKIPMDQNRKPAVNTLQAQPLPNHFECDHRQDDQGRETDTSYNT